MKVFCTSRSPVPFCGGRGTWSCTIGVRADKFCLFRVLYHEGVNTEPDSCAAGSEGDPYSQALFQVVCMVVPAYPEHAFAASFEQP